jgi:cytochrome c-type biogenesis protein CcmH/NrfG
MPFDLPLALFLLTAAVGVWAAYDREAAWAKFWLIVGAVLLFYAFANARTTPAAARAGLVTGFAVGLSLYFLATNDWTFYEAEFEAMNRLGRSLQRLLPPLPGPRLNPNDTGGLLAAMLPFAAWANLRPWQKAVDPSGQRKLAIWLEVLLASGALALVLLGLVMTGSRGAWLACGVAGLAGGLCWAAGCLTRSDTKQRWILLGLLVTALIVTVGIGTLWLAAKVPLAQVFDLTTWFNRLEFQRNSLTLMKDYALIGAGLDGFEMLYTTYVLLIHVGYISHSHSLFTGVAIDQGLPGLLALIWMWALFAALIWHAVRLSGRDQAQVTDRASLAGIAALSLLIVLLHGTVENALYGRGVLFLFVPLAFAVPATSEEVRRVRQRRVLSFLVVGLPLCLALLWPGKTLSSVHSSLGSVYQSQAELSVYSWPEWRLQDEVRRQVDMGKAMSEFEKALALNPHNATANRRLGMIELSLGQYEDALAHLEAAYAVEPNVTTTRQLFGEALIVNGRIEEGQALWSDVTREQGQLDARIFWYEYIGDTERAAWIRQAASGQ